MKKNLHILAIILVIAMLSIANDSFSQTQPPTVLIPTLTCQEGTFIVPVTVKNFEGVGNISLSVKYNPSMLIFEDAVMNPDMPTDNLIKTPAQDASGHFRISYSSNTGIKLADESVLFTLTFTVKQGVSNTTIPITWSTLQGDCELLPPYPGTFNTPISADNFSTYFVNGSVRIKTIPTISGPNSVCPGSSGNIYTTEPGKLNYSWHVSSEGRITSGESTNSIRVSWPETVSSHTVSVTYSDPSNGCLSATPTIYPVTVSNTVTPTINGPKNVCVGTTDQLYFTDPGMSNYHWSVEGGTITSGGLTNNNSATISWDTPGEHSVTVNYTPPDECSTIPSKYTVYVEPSVGTPTHITISAGFEPLCQLTNATTTTSYSTTASNNSGFEWSISNPAAGIINPSTGVMQWANGFSGSVDIRVRALGCNGPSTQVTRSVTINPNVGTPTPIIVLAGYEPTELTNPLSTSTIYSTTASGSNSFNWSISNPAAGTMNPTTGEMTWAYGFTGSVDIQVTANGCNGPSPQRTRTVTLSSSTTITYDSIPKTLIPTLTCQVDSIIVPVTIKNFKGVGNISLTLNYDQTKIIYTGATINPAIPTNNLITTSPNNAAGQFRLSYSGTNGITLPDGAALFTLTFLIKKGVSDFTTPLTWSTLQGECDYSPPLPNEYKVPVTSANFSTYFINGSAAVNAVPTIIGPNSICPGSTGNVYTTEAGMSDYQWNVSEGGIITGGNATNSITVTWPAAIGSHIVSVRYKDPTFECSTPTTTYYPVDVETVVTPTLSGPNNICQGSSGVVYSTEPNMSNYQWQVFGGSITSGGTSNSHTVTVTWGNPGEKSITVVYTPAGGCTSTPIVYPVTVTPTVGTPTTITISHGHEPTCQLKNSTTTTSYTTTATNNTGFNWSISNPAAGTIDPSSGLMTWANEFAGVVDIIVTANGCNGPSAQTKRRVNVSLAPTATISYAGSPYCQSVVSTQPVTLIGTAGGHFSSPTGLTINTATGAITPGTSTSGTYTVSYTIEEDDGCPRFTTTTSVTIFNAPTAVISYSGTPFCSSTDPVTVNLSGTTGGKFSVAPSGLSINANTGTITPGTSTPGNYTITYLIEAAGGCSAVSATTQVTISAAPNATISYAGNPFCSSADPTNVTLTGTKGGLFSAPVGLSIDAASGTITPGKSTPGNYIVTYTIPAASGCAQFIATTAVTIAAAPTASISYSGTPYCQSITTAQAVTFTGTTGGTFSSTTGLTIDAATGAINPSTSKPGTYTVTYSTAKSGLFSIAIAEVCSSVTTTTSVTITEAPSASISYTGTPFCSASGPVNVTLTGSMGGIFSAPAELKINTTTGTITPGTSTPGTYTVTYTIAAAGGCSQVSTSTSVTIDPATVGGSLSSGLASIYLGQSSGIITLSGQIGTVIKWQKRLGNGDWIDIINSQPTYTDYPNAVGRWEYRAVVSSGSCGTTNSASLFIDVLNSNAGAVTGGNSPICLGSSTGTMTLAGHTGSILYWEKRLEVTGTWINVANTSSTLEDTPSAPGTWYYRAVVNNSSVMYSAPATIFVNALSVGGTVSSNQTICDDVSPSDLTLNGYTGTVVKWQKSSDAAFDSPIDLQVTSSTLSGAVIGILPSNTYFRAVVQNGTCSPVYSSSVLITVNPDPTASIFYTGSPFCKSLSSDQAVTLSGTTGGTYSSTPGLTIDASTGSITPGSSTPGIYTVKYTIPADGGCSIHTSTTSVTITAPATATISYPNTPFCTSLEKVNVLITGTTGGTFSAPEGLSIDASTGAIYPGTSTAGTYTVTYTLAAYGGCSPITTTTSVTITAAPTATISYEGAPFCKNLSGDKQVTLTGTTGGLFSAKPSGLSINSVTGAITPGTSSEDTYTVTYTIAAASGCAVVKATTSVTITTPPTASISYYGSPFCNSISTAQPVTRTGSSEGRYSATPGGLSINSTTGEIIPANSTAGTYTVSYTIDADGGCGPVITTTSITINAPLSAPVVGTITQPSCGIPTGSVVLRNLPPGNWTINPGTITGTGLSTTLSGLIPGSYSFSVTNATGCTSPISANIVINDPPLIPNWNGTVSSDWNNPANWCSNAVPTASDNVTVQNAPNRLVIKASLGQSAICNNLVIESGADLTIEPGAALTVNGTITNNSIGGIIIQSDATGTGSLIASSSTGTGTAIVQRYMKAGAWHMVSSPISGQSVSNFISVNTSHLSTATNGVSKGMMDYDPVANKWNPYFTDGIGNGNVGSGKGFGIHTNVSDIVTFNGLLQTGTQILTGLSAGNWNCIGNPYTSTIGINRNSSTPNNFLNENALISPQLDPEYSVIYVWDQPDASNGQYGKYTIISNTPIDNAFDVQQGQAFFVKMHQGATSLTFNKNMQGHMPTLSLKATKEKWPLIKLNVNSENLTGTTYIGFNSAMTKGLDPTYDAGLLKGGADLAVYSWLVEGNKGIPFAIQALPEDESGIIVPLGLDFNTGGLVSFTAELQNIPSDYKVILEDKIARTFTDLSKSDYKVTIEPKSKISDRFNLYTTTPINGKDHGIMSNKLYVFADRNIEIRVFGYVKKNTIATLYDISGRVVLAQTLNEGNINIIPLKKNKIGTYILSINDNGNEKGFKITLRE